MNDLQFREERRGTKVVTLSRREIERLRFVRRLLRSLRKRYIRLIYGDQPFVATYFDSSFIVDWKDIVGREIALQNFERRQLINFIAACRRHQPEFFLDIGAHAGLYSCVLMNADVVGRAILFEPDTRNAILLRANLLLNGLLDRTTIHPTAVGRQAGLSWFMRGPDTNTGMARVTDNGVGHQVETVAVDEVTNFSGRTLATKIDVEGFELEVLAGMQRTLNENRGIVQIESTNARHEVIEFMRGNGYELVVDFYRDLFFVKV